MSQIPAVEIVLRRYRKRISLPKLYTELIKKVTELFPEELTESFRLFYNDPDGDFISVSTQQDYEIACVEAQNPNFNFVINPNWEDKQNRATWLRSQSFCLSESFRNDSFANLHEIAKQAANGGAGNIGGRAYGTMRCAPIETSHFVTNPSEGRLSEVAENSPSQLETSPLNARFEEVKPMENQPLQRDNKDPDVECLSCMGKKLGKRGKACKKCNGTGRMSAALSRHIERIIQQEVAKAVQMEFEKHKGNRLTGIDHLGELMPCNYCKHGAGRREMTKQSEISTGCVHCSIF